MRLSKRIAAGLLAALLALSMLTACGGGGSSSESHPSNKNKPPISDDNGKNDGDDNNDSGKQDPPNDNTNPNPDNPGEQPGNGDDNPSGKPESWKKTWTYQYFSKFNGFPNGILLDIEFFGGETNGLREYYIYDRQTKRGYVRFYNDFIDDGVGVEEIILFSEPVGTIGYKGYTIETDEETGEKYAFEGVMQVEEIVTLEPSSDAFDEMIVDDNYTLELNHKTYHAESMWVDYDGKTMAGEAGPSGSGKTLSTYCYNKQTKELEYIVTARETMQVHALSKDFDRNLVNYEQYEIYQTPNFQNR